MSGYEVVIVGGGPAGVSTALFLAHHRPALADRIVVLEKERYPRDKYCAGGLGGRAERALSTLGVRLDVPSVAMNGLCADFEIGSIVVREGQIGSVVRRIEFDHALALAARARGIRVVEGARVTSIGRSGDGVHVSSSAGTFAGRVVVGADGVGSVVRRAMELPFGRLRAQVVEVDTEPSARDRARDLLHFDMRDRACAGYVWHFPTVVDGKALVCRGAYVLCGSAIGGRALGRPAPDAEQVLRLRLAELGLDLDRYRQKRFAERGLDPDQPISRPRVLLAGEAAGIDLMLGEGIAQAIDYGALAGGYLAEKLDRGDLRFDDWGRRVARSTLGLDLRLRRAVMRRFYGDQRDRVERYLRDEPSFLRFGTQYFAGKPRPIANALRAAVTGALLAGRIGVEERAEREPLCGTVVRMTAPFQPTAGMLFGGEFRLVRPLSAGGMGAVYIAEQASTGKLRALKLMHPQLVADNRLRERFEQEARIGAMISSDHVVQVIGAGVDQPTGVPWLAMELLEGEDLAARLQSPAPLSPADVHEVFRQLCHALGAAHRAGVVHRDLKPQNIFLARARTATAPLSVKVLDFGIAKVVAEATTMTAATSSLGTPLWMAPEQTEARGQITPATDVWALGLIAFTMLTRRVYWRVANDPGGAAMPVLLREILFEPIEPASARAAALGCAGRVLSSFDAWFARCVARDPSARFPTAQEAFDALAPALFGATGVGAAVAATAAAPTVSVMPPSSAAVASFSLVNAPTAPASTFFPADRAPRPARRSRFVVVSAALALVGVVLLVVVGIVGRNRTSTEVGQRVPVAAHPTLATAVVEAAPRAEGAIEPADASPTSLPSGALKVKPTRPNGRVVTPAPRPFDVEAAHAAVEQKGAMAPVHCRGRDGPKAVSAKVLFNPSGGVKYVSIDPRIAGTPSALCVSMLLGSARVPPFDGDEPKTVSTTVSIE